MEKYSWNFNREAEIWCNDSHNTVEECLKHAKQAIQEKDYTTPEPPPAVFIGENVPFVPYVDPETVLDHLEEQASEFAGESGDDWYAYSPKKREELDELGEALSNVVMNWLEKYGYKPEFYAIQNIKQYPLI